MAKEYFDILIIGGGAAGFFCAANIDKTKYRVGILEQGAQVLQKVKISGGGRCNLTNACFDPRELVQYYPRGNKELRSVFSKFQPADTIEWFQQLGVTLKIETDQRVFPETNNSQTIIDVLYQKVESNPNIEIKTKTTVKELAIEAGKFVVKTNTEVYWADIIIFTTGASTKAFKMLESLGHTIVPPVPSLFTFNIKDDLLLGLSGTSFPYAELRIPELRAEENGALLITHWGLSGPAILKLSAWQARILAEKNYLFDLEVNFLGLSLEQTVALLTDIKLENGQKKLTQVKPVALTQRFWLKVLEVLEFDEGKYWSNLSKKELYAIAHMLCRKVFRVNGKSTFKEEFVTAGGVTLKEIDFKTMASKKVPNLYIAGEVLDIDAVTGGFNFQACWSEAWLIAQHLNKK